MTTNAFHIEGNLISADLLPDIVAGEVKGQQAQDFGFKANDKLEDEIAFIWSEAKSRWAIFQGRLARSPEGETGTSLTREQWVVPLLELLGYQPSYQAKAELIDNQTFAISHRAGQLESLRPEGEGLGEGQGETPPVHIIGCRLSLDKRPPSGTPRLSAHGLMQEYLNRTEHLWGITTNGYQWRLLRDCSLMTRLSYVEFDLGQIFDNENFAEFRLFFRLFHRSRLPEGMEDADKCLLEHYHQESLSQGGRVRDKLRDGVEAALKILGNGFLRHPQSEELRKALALGNDPHPKSLSQEEKDFDSSSPSGRRGWGMRGLTASQYYRQLLMFIYRCLFLMVAESRNLLLAAEDKEKVAIYQQYYSFSRLRDFSDRLTYRPEGFQDLWQGLKVTFGLFEDGDRGNLLGLSPLNGDLFGAQTLAILNDSGLDNHYLLSAVRRLSLYENQGQLRRVNYEALDVEELGSVYESLLDFTPQVTVKDGIYCFDLVTGSDRKTTGSYYTPSELVAQLIKSALEPVIENALASSASVQSGNTTLSPNPSPQGRGEPDKWEISPELAAKMKVIARDLRKNSTPTEAILWQALRNRQLNNAKFRRQHPIGPFVVDFYCHEAGLIVEVDGSIHDLPEQQALDQQRQELLESLGLRFLRVSNQAIQNNLPQVLQTIQQALLLPSPLGRGVGGEGQTTLPPLGKEARGEGKTTPPLPLGRGSGGEGQTTQEKALLSLKICDPACGSGHFLLAAARRIGKELARVRTGEIQPPPEPLRQAIRDVIQHCIYGVDINPLAVDLCKVALWIEGFCRGMSLNFLDHRIKCGNSLVGVMDLEVLREGIPDEAFKPVTGDDKTLGTQFKKRNKKEREQSGQLSLFDIDFAVRQGSYAAAALGVDEIEELTPEGYKRKQEQYEQLRSNAQWWQDFSACNLWTAAFFMPLTEQNLRLIPTTEALKRLLREAGQREQREVQQGSLFAGGETSKSTTFGVVQVVEAANELAANHRFFHWPLEFPEVFNNSPRPFSYEEKRNNESPRPLGEGLGEGKGGFDCVLGNPPWERIKLQEKEFFGSRDAEIATAQNKAEREKLIKTLPERKPALARAFEAAKHEAEAQSKFIRQSGRFPLTAMGDINTYAIFAELVREVINQQGRTGVIVPTGIATDNTTKDFFGDLIKKQNLASLYDFENREAIFSGVHRSYKFALLILSRNPIKETLFSFFLTQPKQLDDKRRVFTLSPQDIALINPNTLTCPVFRTKADADLTKKIYQNHGIILSESKENIHTIRITRMFDMNKQSDLFESLDNIVEKSSRDKYGNFCVNAVKYLPLVDGKSFDSYDHRYATQKLNDNAKIRTGIAESITVEEHQNINFFPNKLLYINEKLVDQWSNGRLSRRWILGLMDVTSSTNHRTVIASMLPDVATDYSVRIVIFDKNDAIYSACLLGLFNSLIFDYITRQKLQGLHLSDYISYQLTVPSKDKLLDSQDFISPRVLELTYTAWDMKPFAEDMGYHGDPFIWDENRRAILRAELDAKYAKLYGLTRDELRYILDPADIHGPDFPSETFRVLKNNEIKKYGEYRTQRLVLAAWDMMGY